MTHELKTWPEYFEAVLSGHKTFEVRKKDRDFKIGDILILKEWDQKTHDYTGREIKKIVSYILEGGQFGLEEGYVVMALNVFLSRSTKYEQDWRDGKYYISRTFEVVVYQGCKDQQHALIGRGENYDDALSILKKRHDAWGWQLIEQREINGIMYFHYAPPEKNLLYFLTFS